MSRKIARPPMRRAASSFLTGAGRAAIEPLEGRTLLTTVVVNSTSDSVTGSGVITLRDAVMMANASSDPTTISFDSTVFATAQTILLGGTQLELSNTAEPTTISGPSAGVSISGNNASRVLQIDQGVTANMSLVSIIDGTTAGAADSSTWGAGISNAGNLTFANATIAGNSAAYVGGVGILSCGRDICFACCARSKQQSRKR